MLTGGRIEVGAANIKVAAGSKELKSANGSEATGQPPAVTAVSCSTGCQVHSCPHAHWVLNRPWGQGGGPGARPPCRASGPPTRAAGAGVRPDATAHRTPCPGLGGSGAVLETKVRRKAGCPRLCGTRAVERGRPPGLRLGGSGRRQTCLLWMPSSPRPGAPWRKAPGPVPRTPSSVKGLWPVSCFPEAMAAACLHHDQCVCVCLVDILDRFSVSRIPNLAYYTVCPLFWPAPVLTTRRLWENLREYFSDHTRKPQINGETESLHVA
ncbi:uncharacterized protein LOC129145404 [Talpa occidentalis]|uniref:uncharacterized protein LOC129145404 n=1 Tax=Talpa occidentalis TaxID=50954 RepID=UPI0023F9E155|nr:uncharacterized protein LOC129145404 [Talpa occidentalis]